MRTPIRILPLISLITLASVLGPAMPVRAASEATITVNKTNDELNSDGDCSLREAVRAANTNHSVDACLAGGSGTDTIILPVGSYQLGIAGVNEDSAVTGDLDVTGYLVIQGAGRDLSVIDGNAIDRVFHVIAGATMGISHLTIQNGVAGAGLRGGGAILNQGILTLQDVILKENSSLSVGGGIDNLGTVTVTDSSIHNNQAEDGGGIFNSEGGMLFIYSSTLSGNTASTDRGGGLDNSGSGTLENVTISDNTAQVGGGIFSDGEFLSVLNSTIVINKALAVPLSNGGNIQSANEIRFINTLVANSQSGPNCAGSGFTSLGHNLDSENTCSFNQSTDIYDQGDPLIGDLLDNGGTTLTHALLVGSPAIDAGDNDVLVCPEKDQRGFSRPADGDGDDVAVCDIGAYEYVDISYIFIPMAIR